MEIWQKLKFNWHLVVVVILALVFFIGTAFYSHQVRSWDYMKWSSPDESANYVFTENYSQTGEIKIFEKYNLYAQDVIRPRSARSDHGSVKPVSFLGIILIYGTLAKFFGSDIIPYLTPLFASLGIIFFYLLIKEIFGKRNALISSFLMASFPVYIYYAARSMFHNVLFVSFLIMGLFFLVKMTTLKQGTPKEFLDFSKNQIKEKSPVFLCAALGGVSIGLALATRTSEALWLLPMFFILWLFNIKKIGFSKLIISLSFCFLALLPTAYWNQVLYGSPLSGGYPEMNQSIHNLSSSGGALVASTVSLNFDLVQQIFKQVTTTIFYFGFEPEKSWQMFQNYFIKMFPGLFFFALMGLFLFLQFWNRRGKSFWAYLTSYLVISLILVLYYGSWTFHDNPDVTRATIGNSYTRYWLPVYFGAIPLASFFIVRLSRGIFPTVKKSLKFYQEKEVKSFNDFLSLEKKRARFTLRTNLIINGIRVLMVYFFILLSLTFVLYGSEEGLIYSVQNARSDKVIFAQVVNNTKKEGVIITEYHDKLFFPERRVVYGLFDDPNMIEVYSQIADHLPLYYFNFSLPEEALEYLNSGRLKEVGLQIETRQKISPDFTLYQLTRLENQKQIK